MRSALRLALIPYVAVVGLVIGVASAISPSGSAIPGANEGTGACTLTTATVPDLATDEQRQNARIIARTALDLGFGQRGVEIALVTALTESTLRNVDFGDYSSKGVMTTSRGLFQQKAEWGPLATRMDPAGATRLFLTGGQAGQKGLDDITGWKQLPVPQAAQRVQLSGFSDGSNYQAQLRLGTSIAAVLVSCSATAVPAPAGDMAMNGSQDPTSFGWVRAGAMEPLVWQGRSFGRVAKGTALLWQDVLTMLAPQIPGGINSDVGCYEDRQNVNNPSRASFHAYGLACDINSGVNANGADPVRLQGKPYALPLNTSTLVAPYGFEWGGSFRGTKDAMHLELHLSPEQVAGYNARRTAG